MRYLLLSAAACGLVLVTAGLAMVYRPAAFIGLGVFLLAFGLWADVG